MKKILALFLAIIMVAGLLPAHVHAASCEGDIHTWGTDGVCTNLECQAVCSHNWGILKVKNCLEGGYTSAKCSICSKINGTYEYNDPMSHSYSGNTCTRCGYTKVDPATCSHTWNKTETCTTCGATHTHNSDKKNIQTCGTSGAYNNEYCTVCNRTMSQVNTPSTHNFAGGNTCSTCGYTKADPATCEHNWNKGDTCTKCGATHTHNSDKKNIQTCGTSGAYNNEYCTVCNRTMSQVNTPSSHNMVGGVCTVCGHEEADECDEHSWNTNGTCTACGANCPHDNQKTNYQNCETGEYNTTVCQDCKKSLGFVAVPGAHTMVDGKCTVCGHEEANECDEHTWNTEGACTTCGAACPHEDSEFIPGNCLDEKSYHTTRCSDCKKNLNIEPASGEHKFGDDGKCTVCGYFDDPDCEHEYGDDDICDYCGGQCPHDNTKTVHNNCTGNGYVTTKCLDCGTIVELKPVPGYHTFRGGICIACGAKDPNYDDVPKTGGDHVMIMTTMTGVALLAAAAYVFDQKRKSC